MSARNTGGPAFPVARDEAFPKDSEAGMSKPGMSLRDYFAAKAMVHIHARDVNGVASPEITANAAYAMADAMLKARSA